MRRAYCLLKPQPVYRHDAFMRGLTAAGFLAEARAPRAVEAGDVLCIWNRYGLEHDLATRFEAAGGTVLVAENGYVGPGGISPHSMEPRQWYALATGGHNGSGTWPAGGPERWDALSVELQPWRTDGDHILVCPNRSFGRPDLIMPLRWAEDVKARLQRVTKREIRIRPHPGNNPVQARPLAEDLRGAHACVIWSSSAGVQALIAGVPVVCGGSRWICRGATGPTPARAREMGANHRDYVLRELAWAQWSVDEIATGEPFARLLERATNREAVAA